MALITIFDTLRPVDAQLICSRLDAAGFHPEVVGELPALSVEGYSLCTGGIQVKVPENEAEEVRALLKEEA